MTINWKKIREEIAERHPSGYLLAVSGGVDSMFLLDFMTRVNVPFTVAHFNHGLRESADRDQDIVTRYCLSRNIPCVFGFANANALRSAPSVEAAARVARYEWLADHAEVRGYARIMTGHHLDDQAETIMLHLFRDHKLSDFGMEVDNGRVYRPLLDVPKSEIIKQATARNVPWAHDETNDDTSFERNWYRHTVLPMIGERRNPLALAKAVNAEKRSRDTYYAGE